jgi:hypothetical protein
MMAESVKESRSDQGVEVRRRATGERMRGRQPLQAAVCRARPRVVAEADVVDAEVGVEACEDRPWQRAAQTDL